ncbi:hypothetical protein [Burkholderia sp. Ac-20379]|uniref:hypothetical protein n=1 Tax=Burkholderia sp. Ac-20379 TaxID=2703900 RepID=UPI00197E0F30|nr:hypothetical protein [Burkholderia sp. Ac-20379]MBN3728739.1 hypothetical protein [Burkholderia sp. Ac-20379]
MKPDINQAPTRQPCRAEPEHGTARRTLKAASGWIEWNEAHDRPDWRRGAVTLDGRFSVEELRALILFAGHGN